MEKQAYNKYAYRLKWENFQLRNNQFQKTYRQRLKAKVIAALGGSCAWCGESNAIFLTVDHINNDGCEHRKSLGVKGGHAVFMDIQKQGYLKDKYRVLCYNCNLARSHFGDEIVKRAVDFRLYGCQLGV